MADKLCDIVLEGGGVKGIALVGALQELETAGYTHCRVAGTSAGAIVGSLFAAGMPVSDMLETMKNLDYTKFRDESVIDRLGIPGKTLSFFFEKGIYEGNYFRGWLAGQLEALGVRTFADLKITEPWAEKLPPQQRYKLVVVVSDVSRGRLVRLPWDYSEYGLNPDEQLVADAVRASMSIPFFYEPVNLKGNYLVDGVLLSNFPIGIFDTTNDWPTFGIKLSARADAFSKMNPVTNPINYGVAIISTMLSAHDQMHIDDPCTQKRTIFVDTFNVNPIDFEISKETQVKLYESGRKYGARFLDTWDFEEYKKTCGKQ
ncbi:MAG: rane protein [Candidatus Saccharibacteria bacterium]|nr:rane protein [Candidatus Saccharibacteria bacterium]